MAADRNIFTIAYDGRYGASELVRGYDCSRESVTDKMFPIQKHEPMRRTLEYVKFNRNINSEEALAELVRRGLRRPTYEDALNFGIEYPSEQKKRGIVFLHEPVKNQCEDKEDKVVLVLFEYAGLRIIHPLKFSSVWPRGYAFPGVAASL